MEAIRRLLFDIDGTLITGVSFDRAIETSLQRVSAYSKANVASLKVALATYEQEYSSYTAITYLKHLRKYVQNLNAISFLPIFFEELQDAIPNQNTCKNIQKQISSLQAARYNLALFSNYFEVSQRNRLTNMHINQYFKAYYGEEMIKPNEEAFMQACGKYSPSACMMIGDNFDTDILPAISCGMHAIYVQPKVKETVILEDMIVVPSVLEVSPMLIKKYEERRKQHDLL